MGVQGLKVSSLKEISSNNDEVAMKVCKNDLDISCKWRKCQVMELVN